MFSKTACCVFGTVALLLGTAAAIAAEEPAGPPPFESVCFDDFDDLRGYPSVEQLRLCLDPVPGQPGKIAAGKRGSHPICNLTGWHRLKDAWQSDSAWRLGLSEVKDLDLYFWAGQEGIALRLHPGMSATWAAYKTTRDGKELQPRTQALWALDNGKYARSRAGTVEIRCRDGRLVLTRGDVVLLSVPFPGLPQEVYLQGTLNLRGSALFSSAPAPLPAAAKRPVLLRVDKPAATAWQLTPAETGQGIEFTKLPDGRVELAAAADVKAAQATMSIGKPGLYEYIFEVEDGEPGSGVFLGDEQGQQLFRVGFARHVETGQTVFCPWLPNATDAEKSYNPTYSVAPFAGRHQWLRVVYGGGLARCYTSGDGLEWSETQPKPTHVSGRCATVGLYCSPAKARRAIKLRSVEVRRLDTLTSLAPAELVERAEISEGIKTLADWLAYSAQSQPQGVLPNVWRRAGAVRVLSDNRPHTLAQPALAWLLDDVLDDFSRSGNAAFLAATGGRDAHAPSDGRAPSDGQAELRVLDEAALLVDLATYGSLPDCPDLSALHERLGRELCRQGHAAPLEAVSAAMLRTPAWIIRIDPFPQGPVYCELLMLAQQERWAEVSRCCRRLRYFLRLGEPSYYTPPWKEHAETTLYLLRWAEAQAWLAAPQSSAALPAGKGALSRTQWRHPLVERLSKESFSLLAEFDAAVEGGEYRGACQVICSWSAEAGGLLPASNDRRLLQSLSAIVESAMQSVPELRRTMREEFAPVGRLRLKQAIADGDAAAVTAIALQFYGTDAAADAHLWLGDRWLSQGEVARAVGHYREALPNVPAERRDGVSARLRLAGAMLGRNAGEPVAAPVELGHTRFTAAEFERLVGQLRQARQGNSSGAASAGAVVAVETPALAPGGYDVRPWARLDAPKDVPWGRRGTHAAATADRLIVTAPDVQVAFDLANGQQKWIYRPSPKAKRANPAAAPRPAIGAGGRLFACRDTDATPELVCLDAADGRIVWTAVLGENVSVASDPMLAGRDLYAVCSVPRADGTLALELAILDPESGRLLGRVALLEFTDLWSGAIPCRATLADNRIVGTAGGTVFCCDLLGRMAWVRRQIWSPRPEKGGDAPLWRQQTHEPPLVAGTRVYATQPGVWAVECLDLETGRLMWRRGLFDLMDVVGCVSQRLIVETVDGLLAIDADSGDTLWRHDVANSLAWRYCGPDGKILCARLQERSGSKQTRQPMLVWLDAGDGRTTAEVPLDIEMKPDTVLGQLLVCGARQWLLLIRDGKSKDREVLELLRQKP